MADFKGMQVILDFITYWSMIAVGLFIYVAVQGAMIGAIVGLYLGLLYLWHLITGQN